MRDEDRRPSDAPAPQAGGGGGGAGAGWGRTLPVVLLGLLGTAVLAGGAAKARSGSGGPQRPPLERVLHARRDIENLGRGLGYAPAAWETDHEYLNRVAHRHGGAAREAAGVLAAQAARARYAPALPEESAAAAEVSAAALRTEMLRDRGVVGRTVVQIRGRASGAAAATRSRVGQLSSSSRRRAPSK